MISDFKWLVALGAAFVSCSAFAQDLNCRYSDIQSELEVVSCVERGAVEVLTLAPRHPAQYEGNLDTLRTYVVRGQHRDAVMKVVGMSSLSSPYNLLLKLPDPYAFLHFDNLPESARIKLARTGWALIDAKDVVYERQDGGEGPGVVCSTHEKSLASETVVVSQCNAFYEDDIAKLKNLLDQIDGHSLN